MLVQSCTFSSPSFLYSSLCCACLCLGLDWQYRPRLRDQMQYCTDHPEEVSKLSKVKAQVEQVKSIMVENIDKVMTNVLPCKGMTWWWISASASYCLPWLNNSAFHFQWYWTLPNSILVWILQCFWMNNLMRIFTSCHQALDRGRQIDELAARTEQLHENVCLLVFCVYRHQTQYLFSQ